MTVAEAAKEVAQKLLVEWSAKEQLLLDRLKFVRAQKKALNDVVREIEANE